MTATSAARWILIGTPNVGKSTLFNRLTGQNVKVVNYPGSTVEVAYGRLLSQPEVEVVDTPGMDWLPNQLSKLEAWWSEYREESVAWTALLDLIRDPAASSRTVVFVFDADQPVRQMLLLNQLMLAIPSHVGLAVVVSMLDHIPIARRTQLLSGLKRELKSVPVIEAERAALELPQATPQALRDVSSVVLLNGVASEALVQSWWSKTEAHVHSQKRNWDSILLGPVSGLALFFSVMSLLFYSIYTLAAPLMDAVESVFLVSQDLVRDSFSRLGFLGSDLGRLASSLIADGILGGFSAVAVFAPQIFVLFVLIGLLEGSGYLARAAALIDRPLTWIGLGGRSFVPVMSGFACAVPAMMACRQIKSERERYLALWILPLMTCSARVPVFALMVGLLIGDDPLKAGFIMAGLYLLGLLVGGLASVASQRILFRALEIEGRLPERGLEAKSRDAFCLEIPRLRQPDLVGVLKSAARKTKSYIVKAGGLIFALSLLLWGLSTFPDFDAADDSERMQNSYASKVGQFLSPVFEPMGGDWRTGTALISAFAAREVFVATLGVLFPPTQADPDTEATESESRDDQDAVYLRERLQKARRADGEPLFTVGSVLALTVFFLIALQCLSTYAIAAKESGSHRFALAQLVVFNLLAYGLAVATYRIFS